MSSLSGIRGLLLDLDGVLILKGAAIPGAAAALAEIDSRGIPYRVVTNTSLVSRATLAEWGRREGFEIPAERILSALSVSASYTAAHFPDGPLFVLASADALREFAGQRLLTNDEADLANAVAAAVVVGDAPEAVSYANLNRAFRLLRGGAELIGMHKNRWWLTPSGPTIDSGAFVAGLEFAASVRAIIVGKPSAAFFHQAAADLAAEIRAADSGRRVARREIAMVGDDIWTDVLAARRAGFRGVFVRSGKHGQAELDRAAVAPRGGGVPDLVAVTLAEVVAALD